MNLSLKSKTQPEILPPWAPGFWDYNCAVKPAQRRFLRVKQHDFGNGNLLWRRCADYRWNDGVEEGQHIRHYCVSFLRIVLVLARNVDHSCEARMGFAF